MDGERSREERRSKCSSLKYDKKQIVRYRYDLIYNPGLNKTMSIVDLISDKVKNLSVFLFTFSMS